MPHEPYAEHETTDGEQIVSVYSCPFCLTAQFSDLLVDALGDLKRHVRDTHPSDWHAVMNAVEASVAQRDRVARQLARDFAGHRLLARRN